MGGSHICKKPRWEGGGSHICWKPRWGEIPYLQEARCGILYLQETYTGGGGDPMSAGNLDGGIPYLQKT